MSSVAAGPAVASIVPDGLDIGDCTGLIAPVGKPDNTSGDRAISVWTSTLLDEEEEVVR